nr:hypothetical protein HmN_000881700 [Hymenolepis microstoma]
MEAADDIVRRANSLVAVTSTSKTSATLQKVEDTANEEQIPDDKVFAVLFVRQTYDLTPPSQHGSVKVTMTVTYLLFYGVGRDSSNKDVEKRSGLERSSCG